MKKIFKLLIITTLALTLFVSCGSTPIETATPVPVEELTISKNLEDMITHINSKEKEMIYFAEPNLEISGATSAVAFRSPIKGTLLVKIYEYKDMQAFEAAKVKITEFEEYKFGTNIDGTILVLETNDGDVTSAFEAFYAPEVEEEDSSSSK